MRVSLCRDAERERKGGREAGKEREAGTKTGTKTGTETETEMEMEMEEEERWGKEERAGRYNVEKRGRTQLIVGPRLTSASPSFVSTPLLQVVHVSCDEHWHGARAEARGAA